jgi:hypothetical protein
MLCRLCLALRCDVAALTQGLPSGFESLDIAP